MKKEKWEELQAKCLTKYGDEKNAVGVFSYKGMPSAYRLGRFLNKIIPNQTCLDIGCGLLPLPYYMEVANTVIFSGIDPLDDGTERAFDYKCAMAEDMPFLDGYFDNVLFATSLDHLFNPQVAVGEVWRVMDEGGLVIIWTALLGDASNEDHPIGYNDKSIKKLFSRFQFIKSSVLNVAEHLYIFKKQL